MPESYTRDMINSLRALAVHASGMEDYSTAQQLYATMFDLQLRLPEIADRVGDLVNEPYTGRNTGPGERLRLLPMMRDVPFRAQGRFLPPARSCLRCGTTEAVIGPSGMCGMCEVGIGPRGGDNGPHE